MNFETLTHAVRAAIQHGNTLANIDPTRWAETYHVSTEQVRSEFERLLGEMA